MNSLSRCKACGYIMETDQIKGVCPACGLSDKVFEPYKLTISEERYKFLALHIHPIILHFPQAFVVTAFGLLVLSLVFTGQMLENIMIITKFNLLFLPLLVILGALSGIKDGKMRFKKVTTPILKYKIMLSVVFLVLSIVAAILVFVLPVNLISKLILIVLTGAASGVAVVLGKAGGKLMDSIMNGK